LAVVVLLAGAAQTVRGQDTTAPEVASVETETLKEKGQTGWLPIPIFITEPAIGAGFGAALAFFHPRSEDDTEEASLPVMVPASTGHVDDGEKRPPNITGVVAAYTENGTWALGLGHFASWRQDRIRYAGAVAYASVNSSFYLFDLPIDFNLEGGILYQDIKFRLGKSKLFIGGKLSYLDVDADFTLGLHVPPSSFIEGHRSDVGLALQAVYESRDNIFTPNRGRLFEAAAWRHDEALGGNYDYWAFGLKLTSFHPIGERLVLGWRIDLDAVDGQPPFWGYPWISLRGIPAMRYQNRRTGVAEVELRWNLFDRWGVVGFAGTGDTDGNIPAFETEDDIIAGGVGGRWLFKPEMGLWVGVDIARGPERTAYYIQVGQAW